MIQWVGARENVVDSNTGPIHKHQGVFTSKYEGGSPRAPTRSDPETAHKSAGDDGFTQYLPDSCYLCWAKEIALQEAEEQAQKLRDD